MASTNDVTGDTLKTKPGNDQYRDNWEKIFGKKNKPKEEKSGEKMGV